MLRSLLFLLFTLPLSATNFFDSLHGCFAVTYQFSDYNEEIPSADTPPNYTEILGHTQESPFHERITREERNGGFYYQHYGVTPQGEFKHFGELWEEQEGGQWQQTIYSPRDEIRYAATGSLENLQWTGGPTEAPRAINRDKSRTDYSKLQRTNKIETTDGGWQQIENNAKLDDSGNAVSYEKGLISYVRVDDSKCHSAQ